MSTNDLIAVIHREIERFMASRYNRRIGIVSSYDPKAHAAKVKLQPEGQETGWLPVHAHHIGGGWGVMVGLTPGDQKKKNTQDQQGKSGGAQPDQQNTGDQVEIDFQEGDLECGRIIGRMHSDQDKPPPVEAGEMLIKHKTGGSIFFDKNGKITITGGKGQTNQNKKPPDPSATSKPGADGSGHDTSSQDTAGGQTIVFDTDGNITHLGIKGQKLVLDKDGGLAHTGKNGQTVNLDKDGNIKAAGKDGNYCLVDNDGSCTVVDKNGAGIVYVSGGKVYLGDKNASALVSTVSGPSTNVYAKV